MTNKTIIWIVVKMLLHSILLQVHRTILLIDDHLTKTLIIMKKALVILLFLPVVFIVTTHGQERPTIFPGAVPQFESNDDYFLTNGDYESVISYYTGAGGWNCAEVWLFEALLFCLQKEWKGEGCALWWNHFQQAG